MSQFRTRVKSSAADIIVVSETWLTKSIINQDINIYGSNIYGNEKEVVWLFMLNQVLMILCMYGAHLPVNNSRQYAP